MDSFDLIVFSHLRWNFVYQRPQHLLTRLARLRRVLFVEEPINDHAAAAPFWEVNEPERNVVVAAAHTNAQSAGFSAEQTELLRPLLGDLIARAGVKDYVLWFYTPLALPLAQSLNARAVVYDCMDELCLFKGAPRELVERERELLRRADVVFTGGPSLYRAKEGRHHNLHCFPSSVDANHFRQALLVEEAPDMRDMSGPRLGFYGVVDERMDLDLLDVLAAAHPAWHVVIVGPVVKIDPADLPSHPNLHYLGGRRYEQLPSYLAGWDVCLLPFARNDCTRFISPTKTLEYMAAEKMIVSTPIADVAEPYGDFVWLGHTPQQFVAACEQALNASEAERVRRIGRMHEVLARTSWDRTAREMEALIDAAVDKRQSHAMLTRREASAQTEAAPTQWTRRTEGQCETRSW